MNQELLNKLKKISPEEQQILDGHNDIQKNLYTSQKEFIIDSKKMLQKGKLIDIRLHTRFIHFPKHRHNYIEIIYMCSGTTLHIINDSTTVELKTGDLLFLNQNVTQEIMPAGENDIAINFIVLPEFFDRAFIMMEEENVLRNFLIGSLKQDSSMVSYIHFSVSDFLPIQNIIENMIWSIVNKQPNQRNINQTTMGLLFLQLLNHTDKINQNDPNQYEQNTVFTVLKYIEENYKTASLEELAELMHQPTYYISKLIKKHSGYTFKHLLQTKRLNQSAFLLTTTTLPVENIISIVGYDNTSYFHKIFKQHFHMTPKHYREANL
ncbi:MAG: AraC family transcriptional regulator [Lachnospiraceae bacterium]|nr:AraC family transcriptional regulator [Lachnospiraceae bacterium]